MSYLTCIYSAVPFLTVPFLFKYTFFSKQLIHIISYIKIVCFYYSRKCKFAFLKTVEVLL